MGMINNKNALPTIGMLSITINFNVIEIQNKTFISDGNSAFVFNVRENRKKLLNNAIYNAVKREFPNRTVTPYNINILDYHYTYYLNDYKIIRENNKYYETYIDIETKRKKTFVKDLYTIRETNIGEYKPHYNQEEYK
jgi:hypothetical protein